MSDERKAPTRRESSYQAVKFRDAARVLPGAPVNEISAVAGRTTLTRVTEGIRDDLVVESPGSTVDVPWSNVASAERAKVKP